MKVVINSCHGGFGLSSEAMRRLKELGMDLYYYDIPRNHEILVRVVDELGEGANGEHSNLKIIDIPEGISWDIDEYDGYETISEKHRTWG